MRRTVLAGLLGGLAAFVWSAIAHTVLPIGQMGLRTLPEEKRVLEGLRQGISDEGLYIFPAPDLADPSPAAQEDWMERYRTGPTGFLVYRSVGGEFSFPRHLVIELVTTVVAGLLAAVVLARTPLSLGRGALLGGALGVFTWFSINASYWNWYDFPITFVLGEGIDQVVGWSLAGIVIAKLAPGLRASG